MNHKTARTDAEPQLPRVQAISVTKRLYRSIFSTFLAGALLGGSTALHAEELLLEAITDFPNINAGEIPYYVDTVGDRNVLAINAAIEEYRDLFARAVTYFDGSSGIYDVTITALGEIDGEGEFRFLVNGELRGSAVNELVDEDWGEQLHVFENIELEAGDEIAVESNARSNGLIPENGEYAFARGRWRSLGLVLDDEATAITEAADLSIVLDGVDTQLLVGDSTEISLVIGNAVDSEVATGISIDVELSPTLMFSSAEGCSVEQMSSTTESTAQSATLSCAIAELAADSTATLQLDVAAIDPGVGSLIVSVSSAQADPQLENNSAQLTFTIEPMTNASVTSLPSDSDAVESDIGNETELIASTSGENSETVTAIASQANGTVGSTGSGGGGGALWWLLPVLATVYFRRVEKLLFKSSDY